MTDRYTVKRLAELVGIIKCDMRGQTFTCELERNMFVAESLLERRYGW